MKKKKENQKKKKKLVVNKKTNTSNSHKRNIPVTKPTSDSLKSEHKNKTTSVKKTKRKRKFKLKKLFTIIGIIILAFGIITLIATGIFLGYIVKVAPHFDPENLYRKEATIIYNSENKIITKIGREIRDKITYNQIPEIFVDAIVATEDARFFQHNGFDAPRFLRAGLGEVSGQNAGGASTLSMQVVKNSFTSTKRSYIRKFTDIYLSIFKLEKKYTKEEILEFYVNQPYLGNGSYGIAEAARNYFGKEIGDINLSEAAMLAGLFQAPGAYDPYLYPESTERRRKTVLYLMKRHGYINEEEEKVANAIPISSLLIGRTSDDNMAYQGYLDVVIEEIEAKTGHSPYNVPMKIYTNFSDKKQAYINDVLDGGLYKFPNDVIQAGIAVTDINSGAVIAIGNGRKRSGERLFNFATMLKRQIGSTAKPIFEYGPGMEESNWSTYTPFLDDVHSYSNKKPMTNWDGKYFGLQTLRDALAKSRNIPALKAFQSLNNKKILDFSLSLGMTPEIDNGHIHEAHSIGAFNGASPLQLAAAYAAFGNGGYYIEPYTINKVEYIDTKEVVTFKPVKERVMSDSTAFMITDILKSAVDTGAVAGGKLAGIEVAAKSGTTNFDEETKARFKLPSNVLNDLWYVGYSPEHSIGMWLGYEKIDSVHYNTSASWGVRDRLFSTLAKGIFEKTNAKFEVPKSVIKVTVEQKTVPAMLPSQWTPQSMMTTEYFKRGTEPTEVSPRFRTLPNPGNIDIKTNDSKITLTWDHVNISDMITDEMIKVFGNHKDKYINSYRQENLDILGVVGYEIYRKKNGQLTLLDWTTSNTYSHKPTSGGNLTYVVKTSYSIFKDNRSSGHEISISDNPYVPLIDISLVGGTSVTVPIGGLYSEQGVQLIVNLVNVTSDAVITKVTTRVSDGQVIANNQINTSVAETYTIKYDIAYDNELYTLTRTVTVQ